MTTNKKTKQQNTQPSIDTLAIEQALSTQGHFCLLDWLISQNHLPYGDYEKWRYGEILHLDSQLKLEKQALTTLTETVAALSEKLALQALDEDYYPWSENKKNLLKASRDKALHRALTQYWQRHQDVPQMDLFMDNSANIAENTLLNALASRRYSEAQAQLAKLAQLNSAHEKLGHYQDLINYGYHMENLDIEVEGISAELQALEDEVLPLAKSVLKHKARDYLAYAWRRLEKNLQGSPFDPKNSRIHCSYALMQIPDWQEAANSLIAEKHQFDDAVLIQRSAQCYEAMKEENKALLFWCLLMELDAEKCEAAIDLKHSSLIWNLWQDFLDIDDSDEISRELFPAYVFTRRPGLIHHLENIPALKSPAVSAVIEGIQGRQLQQDDIAVRKKLQAISPTLLAFYLDNIYR